MKCIKCGAAAPKGLYCCHCGSKQTASLTLRELYEEWKSLHFRRISKKTQLGYENAWNKTLSAYADRAVVSLELNEYQQLMDTLANQSHSTQEKLRGLISQLCKYAAVIKKLDVSNCASYLFLDGYEREERDIFTDEEITTLFAYAKLSERHSRDARILIVLMFTGFRIDELFSIKKENIDLNEMFFLSAGSKTKAGKNRLIPIVPLIQPFVIAFHGEKPSSEYLISNQSGNRIDVHNWRRRNFSRTLRALNILWPDDLKRLCPHCTRHTYASLAKRAKVDNAILVKMIGHVRFKTTEQIYIHERLDEYAAEQSKIDKLARNFIKGV